DPEHGEGIGNFVCIDAATGKQLWNYTKIARSLSTPSIVDGLLYVADFSGFVHCLDAETGKPYWVFDTKSHIWGSTLVADGKVYVGTEDGDIVVLAAGKTLKELSRADMRAPVYASPVLANGTMYIATPTHLYAVGGGAPTPAPKTATRDDANGNARMIARAVALRREHDRVIGCSGHGHNKRILTVAK
ncbi:MAG: PQQ-binding-like beta-propeller repeat protein, partial [Fibrella sp.]|nr:PQQ-binding-like beta-propeller repeat protein [Armatimonadota bacterium]